MDAPTLLFALGPLQVSSTVLITWGLMAALTLACWLVTRRLTLTPNRWQSVLEAAVLAIEDAIEGIAPGRAARLLPFIGTLWIYLAIANLVGIVPGLHAPTGELSVTAGLAILVFGATHWFGIREAGLSDYLRHYVSPSPILLPFHLIGEVSRTVALAVRLFGNIMSLELAALLVLLVAGPLVPVPILMLHVVEALVQAYIFGVLALVFIAGGLEAHPAAPIPGASTT